MGKYFGTDGIRGVVNQNLDGELAYRVGVAAAMVLAKGKEGRPCITIGKDTRISGDLLEAALSAGLCAAGADVIPLGVVPTPAVAFVTRDCGADAGIVISAYITPMSTMGSRYSAARDLNSPMHWRERWRHCWMRRSVCSSKKTVRLAEFLTEGETM